MHPILKSKNALSGYLVGWILLGTILGLMLKTTSHLSWPETAALTVPISIVLAVICLSAWFVSRSLPFKTTPDWKLALSFALAAMCASALNGAFTHLLVWLGNKWDPGIEQRFLPAAPALGVLACLLYLHAILLHYLIISMETSQKAEILSREAELKALKAQVNPHFLFNSLNSISALTSVDPSKAREMCVALSDFLRSSLRLGESISIPLGQELALTKSYLDVERVRFGERLRVMQRVETGCAECDVPPLLVQPLVENAVKHGIATLSEGGEVSIRGRRWNGQLQVTIENPFDPDAPPALRNGFGLASVRNRIQARYGHAGKLEIEVEQARYRVVLSLPWCQDGRIETERSAAQP